MRLNRYGVVLESLNQDHLEMVRLWRNQSHVRMNMQFQEKLSRDDQQAWFNNLNFERNLYWIIRSKDYPIGLIHIKNIDSSFASGEAGIFIGEPSYLYMPQPILAILFMMEMAFVVLEFKELKAKIKSGNHHAISFNTKLGYELVPDQSDGFQYYTVNREQFMNSTEKLRIQAQHMYGSETVVVQDHQLNDLGAKLITGLSKSEMYFNLKFV